MSKNSGDVFENSISTSLRVLPLNFHQGNRKQCIDWVDSHQILPSVPIEGDLLTVDFDVCILGDWGEGN